MQVHQSIKKPKSKNVRDEAGNQNAIEKKFANNGLDMVLIEMRSH